MHRTTLLLDEESHRAAKELASRLDCSTSEAIRRAIVRYRDLTLGASPELRQHRKRVLQELFSLFEGHDAGEEIARLKSEDLGF
ncbi:MAG: hypothetical protein KC910_31550 [Candidatus Eremiobacteraeota bacterium]|nr:hypothetical protein [Candidatus Eremiobacteraeota bacterium]